MMTSWHGHWGAGADSYAPHYPTTSGMMTTGWNHGTMHTHAHRYVSHAPSIFGSITDCAADASVIQPTDMPDPRPFEHPVHQRIRGPGVAARHHHHVAGTHAHMAPSHTSAILPTASVYNSFPAAYSPYASAAYSMSNGSLHSAPTHTHFASSPWGTTHTSSHFPTPFTPHDHAAAWPTAMFPHTHTTFGAAAGVAHGGVGMPAAFAAASGAVGGEEPVVGDAAATLPPTAPPIVRCGTRQKPRVQIVIPMAGSGQRFVDAGYTTPKPLITVEKNDQRKAMARMVADNVRSDVVDAKIIFVVQRKHYEAHGGAEAIANAVPGCEIVFVETLTEGPACTVLVAEPVLDRDLPLFICNSDQFVEWDVDAFYRRVLGLVDPADSAAVPAPAPQAAILCFKHPEKETKWSYAAHDADGRVTAVAEKNPISESATVGFYWFGKAGTFIDDARSMMKKNVRGPSKVQVWRVGVTASRSCIRTSVNNEFYVTPVFDECLARGDDVRALFCDKMWGTGTPADYEKFLYGYKGPI